MTFFLPWMLNISYICSRMKRVSLTILAVVLAGCAGLFGKSFSGAPSAMPVSRTLHSPMGFISPLFVEHSPLNFIFSLEPLDHQVCRKPLLFFSGKDPLAAGYHYKGMFFQTAPIGSNYLRVNGNVVFQKGNSFLLLPNTFTLPLNSPVQQLPTMTLPKAD